MLLRYLKEYKRYRLKPGFHDSAGRLINSTKTKPQDFYSNLGVYGYKTKVETITWYKIESFNINAKNQEIQKGTYKVTADSPNRAASNIASWTTQYQK